MGSYGDGSYGGNYNDGSSDMVTVVICNCDVGSYGDGSCGDGGYGDGGYGSCDESSGVDDDAIFMIHMIVMRTMIVMLLMTI